MDLTARRRRLEGAGCAIHIDEDGTGVMGPSGDRPPTMPYCRITLSDAKTVITQARSTREEATAAAFAEAERALGFE